MIPVIGFAPDADRTTPGVISDCVNMIPNNDGMEGAPEPISAMIDALADPCSGAEVVYKLDGSYRVFAGTADAIYELSGSSWANQSQTAGYATGADAQWMFAQFGDSSLAATLAETIQRSTGTAFADISGAPKAQTIFTVGDFVMAMNVHDGASKPDGWHCCAIFDDTDWTESTVTQSASGRLVSSPGRITAGGALGSYAVAYKERAIYLGQYVGPPAVWQWRRIQSGDAGCAGQKAFCDIGSSHFVVGADNFWLFDGNQAVSIGDGVIRKFFVEDLNQDLAYKTKCIFDKVKNLVWVFYHSSSSEVCDSAIVYNVKTTRWGRVDIEVQEAFLYTAPGVTYDSFGTLASTYDDLPLISYDSPTWISGTRELAIVDAANDVKTMSGASIESSLTSWEVGGEDMLSMLTEIGAKFIAAPTSAEVQTFHSSNSGSSFSAGPTGEMSDGRFDVRKTARWHKARIDFQGPVIISALNAKISGAGKR